MSSYKLKYCDAAGGVFRGLPGLGTSVFSGWQAVSLSSGQWLNPFNSARRYCFHQRGLELESVLFVFDPPALGLQPLACGCGRQRSKHRHLVAVSREIGNQRNFGLLVMAPLKPGHLAAQVGLEVGLDAMEISHKPPQL